MIVSLPEERARNVSHNCNVPISLHDLCPTILDVAGIDPPGDHEGSTLISLMYGTYGDINDRSYVHGEHAACYDPDNAMQYLTDGKEKYIWFPTKGEEQFFDLKNDPSECHNLAAAGSRNTAIEVWRQRLVKYLYGQGRNALSDGKKLISGESPPSVRPELLKE